MVHHAVSALYQVLIPSFAFQLLMLSPIIEHLEKIEVQNQERHIFLKKNFVQ